nr:metabotropic glutamate receptor 3-like [Biomphalaria glabrata]
MLPATHIYFLCLVLPVSRPYVITPIIRDKLYIRDGDLSIGALFSLTKPNESDPMCGEAVPDFEAVEIAETVDFAITYINEKSKLLPGVKLGFVIADACSKESIAALQAVRFLPRSNPEDYLQPKNPLYLQSFDVIGVIGTDQSFTTALVSDILNGNRIPVISFAATDDILDDDKLYPILYRMVPPDKNIAHAIKKFFLFQNWSHINVVVNPDVYKTEASFSNIMGILSQNFKCFSAVFEVDERFNFKKMINSILNSETASRIVLILTDELTMGMIIRAVEETQSEGKLLWVGLDKWVKLMIKKAVPLGSIGITDQGRYKSGFLEHLQRAEEKKVNPWLETAINGTLNCMSKSCFENQLKRLKDMPNLTPSMYNAVMVFAHSLSIFLKRYCRTLNGSNAVRCFRSKRLKFPLLIANVSFVEETEEIRFTKHHYVNRPFSFYQYVGRRNKTLRSLAYQSKTNNTLKLLNDLDLTVFRFNVSYLNIKSYCTPVCQKHEAHNYTSHCCYTCLACKGDQFVNKKFSTCQHCPSLHWPKLLPDNETECRPIPPFYLNMEDNVCTLLLAFSSACTLLVLLFGYLYWAKRRSIVVKASSFEISIGQMICFVTGYLAVPVLLLKPTYASCTIGVLMFTLSFNNSYMLMLIKAIRVYRIFKASMKMKRRISFTQTKFVLGASVVYFIFEVRLFR